MSDSNKRVLQEANAEISRGNIEGFLKFCTDDTKWTFVGDKTISGKEALREWMTTAYREPPRFEVHRLIAEDDLVTALGEITLNDEKGQAIRYELGEGTHAMVLEKHRMRLIGEVQQFLEE